MIPFAAKFLALTLIAFLVPVVCAAQEDRRSLMPSPPDVGVLVEKSSSDGRMLASGSGILLNGGLVLTAAHVVRLNAQNPDVTVILNSLRVHGAVIRNGDSQHRDLALILIDPTDMRLFRPAQQAGVAICTDNPRTNQPVVVVSNGVTTRSSTISSPITSDGQTVTGQTGGWTNLLTTGYHPGNSGGGVFNPQRNCLWGVINLELSGTVDGRSLDLTAFVPALAIAAFLNGR